MFKVLRQCMRTPDTNRLTLAMLKGYFSPRHMNAKIFVNTS